MLIVFSVIDTSVTDIILVAVYIAFGTILMSSSVYLRLLIYMFELYLLWLHYFWNL